MPIGESDLSAGLSSKLKLTLSKTIGFQPSGATGIGGDEISFGTI